MTSGVIATFSNFAQRSLSLLKEHVLEQVRSKDLEEKILVLSMLMSFSSSLSILSSSCLSRTVSSVVSKLSIALMLSVAIVLLNCGERAKQARALASFSPLT